jgi:hypothetical protein
VVGEWWVVMCVSVMWAYDDACDDTSASNFNENSRGMSQSYSRTHTHVYIYIIYMYYNYIYICIYVSKYTRNIRRRACPEAAQGVALGVRGGLGRLPD